MVVLVLNAICQLVCFFKHCNAVEIAPRTVKASCAVSVSVLKMVFYPHS